MSTELSIIVPAYNAEKYLPDCLNSILASIYRDFEILLVDDGSFDGTGDICDQFQREHPQIRVFHTENRGLPSARNLGLDNASGQFVGFVDADDLVAPDMFDQLVCAMKSNAQLGVCGFQRCVRSNVAAGCSNGVTLFTEYDQVGAAELILRKGVALMSGIRYTEKISSNLMKFDLDQILRVRRINFSTRIS